MNVNLSEWGPNGLLKVLLKDVLGVDGALTLKLKGDRVAEYACCARKQKKEDKQTTQGSLEIEAAVDGELFKSTPLGFILSKFQVTSFLRLKAVGSGTVYVASDYCAEDFEKSRYSASGQLAGAAEIGLRFGRVRPSPTDVSGVAVEGFGGIEAVGKIVSNTNSTQPNVDVESTLTGYVQLDIVAPTGVISLFKRSIDITKTSTADVRQLVQ